MKLILIVWVGLLSTFSLSLHAQLNQVSSVSTSQSSSRYQWFEINTKHVRLIFPEVREKEAQQVASLIENYAPVVGKNMGILDPMKFPLILRPDVALPNGFVTLAPRRSEWYMQETYIPFVGGLNFYDALAIHEYRHVNQFDFFRRSTNKFVYALFGEYGQAVMQGIGLPNWYFEGDAVWSETRYTQGGRGRSPRFAARLKAMILSGNTPSYDELVGRTYKTNLPNHYVFGYFLIARAYKIYGDDIWTKVVDEVSDFALDPYRLYKAFEWKTGKDFDLFVEETFADMKKQWESDGDKIQGSKDAEYERFAYPMIDEGRIYYLRKGLNTYWELHEKGRGEVITELPIYPDYSKVDLKKGRLAYTQNLPGLRYSMQSYYDLFTYDLKKDETVRWTDDLKVYHPSWSPDGSKIAFVENREEKGWNVGVMSAPQSKVQRLHFKNETPFEVVWKDGHSFYVLLQNKLGFRFVKMIDLKTKHSQIVINPTRNNLFNLRVFKDRLLFEADWKGKVEAFSYQQGQMSKCSSEAIAAFMPNAYSSSKGDMLIYSYEGAQGQHLKSTPLSQCQKMKAQELLGEQRIAGNISDALSGNEGLAITDKTLQSSFSKEDYNELFGGLSPHSWSFLGNNGYALSLYGDNYLGTMSYGFSAGYDAEEEKPYTNLSLSYSELYPVFTLLGEYRQRNDETIDGYPSLEWNETEYGLRMTLPFQWVSGFYTSNLDLTLDSGQIAVSSKTYSWMYQLNDETLTYHSAGLAYSSLKAATLQQIYSPWGISLRAFYRDATSDERNTYGSSQLHLRGSLYLPSFFENHGLKLSYYHEEQTKGLNNYRHEPLEVSSSEYTLGRGYNYSYVDNFDKFSVDYALPLLMPDLDLWGWAYIRRLYAVPFYDQTDYQILSRTGTLTSYGSEFYMETNLLRRFPIVIGGRYSVRETYSDAVWDIIFGLNYSL